MKIHSPLVTVLLLLSAVSALAQVPIKITQQRSLASMSSDEKYVSEKYGFTIALPNDPIEKPVEENGARSMVFTWELKEGTIVVKHSEFLNGAVFTTERDREWFLKGYISNFEKNDNFKSLTEKPYSVGEYKGKTYSMLLLGLKFQNSVLLAGKRSFEIAAVEKGDNPSAPSLVLKAANSFSILPTPIKQ